jgi:hypothetical protein
MRRDEPLFGHQCLGVEGEQGYDGKTYPYPRRGGGIVCVISVGGGGSSHGRASKGELPVHVAADEQQNTGSTWPHGNSKTRESTWPHGFDDGDDAFLQDRCSPLLLVIINQKSPL